MQRILVGPRLRWELRVRRRERALNILIGANVLGLAVIGAAGASYWRSRRRQHREAASRRAAPAITPAVARPATEWPMPPAPRKPLPPVVREPVAAPTYGIDGLHRPISGVAGVR